jgi:DNA-binding MarR family transcriptional regulator
MIASVTAAIEALATEINSVAIHLVRRVRRTDVQLGVPPAQLAALSVLVFGGSQTASSLAASEQVTAPTMTRIVQGLERRGLARRRPHPDDGRASIIVATARGRRLMERGRGLRVAQLERALDGLDRAELDDLRRGIVLLRRIEHQLRTGQVASNR